MTDENDRKNRPGPAETKLVIASYHRFTLWRSPPELATRVRERFPEMRVVDLPHHERLPPELPDTDIFVGYLLRPEQLRLAMRLKWIHSTAAGVAQLLYPEMRSSGITITNASGVHAPAMAEHIVGMIVAMARDFQGRCAHSLNGSGRSSKYGTGHIGRANLAAIPC